MVDVPPPPHPTAPQNLGPSYLFRDFSFDVLRIATEPFLAELQAQNRPASHQILADWVQDSRGIVRPVVNGGLLKNGMSICGSGASEYLFWWIEAPYSDYPFAELRVVPL